MNDIKELRKAILQRQAARPETKKDILNGILVASGTIAVVILATLVFI